MLAAAHIAAAKKPKGGKGKARALPESIARAQASRAKVTDLSDGQVIVKEVPQSPEALLRRVLRRGGLSAWGGDGATPLCGRRSSSSPMNLIGSSACAVAAAVTAAWSAFWITSRWLAR